MSSPAEVAQAMVAVLNEGVEEMNKLMRRARSTAAEAREHPSGGSTEHRDDLRTCMERIVRVSELTASEFRGHLDQADFNQAQRGLLRSKLEDFHGRDKIARYVVGKLLDAMPPAPETADQGESMSIEQIDELLFGDEG